MHVGPSQIHGRGVMASKAVAKGTELGLHWYDYLFQQSSCNAQPDALSPRRGYVPDGGTLFSKTMTVEAAQSECAGLPECLGITFDLGEGGTCVAGADRAADSSGSDNCAGEIFIEFKDKATVIEYARWRSFVKASRHMTYYPFSCNAPMYPEGEERAEISSEQAMACWPRWVNHACRPNTAIAFHPVEAVVPLMPWARCVREVRAVALRDLEAGEEMTLNYETLPLYMLREVPGVAPCNATTS